MGWTDDAGRRGGQQRFEDIVLLLPDEESEYGCRDWSETEGGGKRDPQEFGGPNYEIISRIGRPISRYYLIDGNCDKYVMDGTKLEHDIVAEC
jgi:hypothetical protein